MNNSHSNANPVSSSAPASFPPFFRRRTLGRAPSPPTWACYEQIPPPASDSDDCDTDVQTDSDTQSGSDSEVEDEYVQEKTMCPDSPGGDMEMEMQVGEPGSDALCGTGMELDGPSGDDRNQDKSGAENACGSAGEQCNDDDCEQRLKRQDKGKQRAIEPELETLPVEKSPKKRHRKRRHHDTSSMYRPILTIKKSEGFVWNQVRQPCHSCGSALTGTCTHFQDLFVPSYIKDRYIASTSPPCSGFTSTTSMLTSVPASELHDNYEVEVVEIRVQGNELDGILS